MFIKKLELQNFQVIKDFNADFEGNVYFITGDNEKGKSTILKSIGILLTGNRDEVLKNGEEKGFAKMIVGNDGENYEVELKFTKANPRGTLTIKSQSTGMKSDNVSMIQKIFGYKDFDAVEFSRWSETAEGRRKQIEAVKALLPQEVQDRINKIDEDIKSKKELRKDVNSEVKTLSSICSAAEKEIKPGDVKTYEKPVEISELMEKQNENAQLIAKATGVRQKLEERKAQLAEIPGLIQKAKFEEKHTRESLDLELDKIKKEYEQAVANIQERHKLAENKRIEAVKRIEADKKDYETRKETAEKWLKEYEANNPEKSNITEQLQNADLHNKKHAKVVDYLNKKKQKDAADKKAAKFDKEIADLTKERENLIAKSKLPIDGLTFTDDGLELGGVPLVAGKVSDSQIMEVAAKLIIASNPTVNVFRIARGESLGESRLQSLIDIAKKNNFQGFIEEVKRGQDDLIIEEYTEQ